MLGAIVFASVQVQQKKPGATTEDRPVANEDGGQAFIIETAGTLAPGNARKTRNSRPEQCSIFLGSEWTNSPLQEREAQLQSLLANVTDETALAYLQESGITDRFGPATRVETSAISAREISDTDIQRLITSMLSEGSLARPNSKTIYVIFLDSTLQSQLGSLFGGKHYLAYHSSFRTSGADVRYVVVHFQSDPTIANQIALRAFVAAASSPGQPAK
jgi:hypothetical protein